VRISKFSLQWAVAIRVRVTQISFTVKLAEAANPCLVQISYTYL